jgi:hypothetical protein
MVRREQLYLIVRINDTTHPVQTQQVEISSSMPIMGQIKDGTCNTSKNLTFFSCSDGLPWPIEDFYSITTLITHGVHCVDIIHQNGSSSYHLFHQKHCLKLMQEIDNFFKQSPEYSVPEEICQDFRKIAFPGGRIRRGSWETKFWDYIIGRKKREVTPVKEVSQDIAFKGTATRNFELLLLKEERGLNLSEREKRYLERSRSPYATRIAALGIFCKYEGYKGVVKDAIELRS